MKNFIYLKKTILVVLFALTFKLPCIYGQQYTLQDDDVVVEDGIIKSCSYNFVLKDIIIPQTLDGQNVTGIGLPNYAGVFYNKGITSVILPVSLKTIGANAFWINNITSLDLSVCPELTTIGESAFESNSIAILNLTNCTSLISIGNRAFDNNKLSGLDLSDCTALKTIGDYSFYSNSITSLNLTNCKELMSMGDYAFSLNKLTGLDLSGCTKLLSIGYRAFYQNPSLTSFALPEITYKGSVYKIWKDGNNNTYTAGTDPANNLNTFYVTFIQYTLTDNDVVVEGGVIISCSYNFELRNIIIPQNLDGQTVIAIADGTSFSAGVFYNKGITSVQLPSSVQTVGGYAFYDNKLISLDLSVCPEISTIGDYAFYSNSITGLDLNNCTSMISIGSYAFYSNPSVTGFILPKPVITGYFYSYWKDGDGGTHSGSESVSNLTTSYTRIMPEITAIDPIYVSTAGSEEISIIGKNFENEKYNKKVLINGIEPLSYSSWSDNLIKVICPPNPKGSVKIEIALENNINYTSPKHLYYSDDDIVTVCGNVSGTWLTGKTYLLNCSVTIPDGQTLIIEQGVKVVAMADEQIELYCSGNLEVTGTISNPVIFTSTNNTPGSWEGIKIYGTNQNCKFNYCVFEYATTAVSLYGEATGCSSYSNHSEFKSCIIRNNSKDGFYCEGSGDPSSGCTIPKTGACSPLIENCQIYNNGEEGIELVAYDGYLSNGYIGARVHNNLIYNNRNGIYSYGDDNVEPQIVNNVITKNSESAIKSTHSVFNTDYYKIANNIFSNNGKGVVNEFSTAIILNNNGFWSNSVDMTGQFQNVSNIFENPFFVDFQNNDFRLQQVSHYIDAGSNDFVDFETDFNGKIRIIDGLGSGVSKVDIGAYEFNSYFTGVNEKEIPGLLKLFPNPTKGIIQVEGFSPYEKIKITLLDISGKQILQFENTGSTAIIDLTNYNPGVYLIYLGGERQKAIKIIKE